jgi:excisionase family DNA binding protein
LTLVKYGIILSLKQLFPNIAEMARRLDSVENRGLGMNEARKIIGVSYPKMLELVHSAGFPAFRVGVKWIIPVEQLSEWMKKQAESRQGR